MCSTTSIEALADEAEKLTREIEGGLLTFASDEARNEWTMFLMRWHSTRISTDLGGADDAFAAEVGKMRRFRTILEDRSRRHAADADAEAA